MGGQRRVVPAHLPTEPGDALESCSARLAPSRNRPLMRMRRSWSHRTSTLRDFSPFLSEFSSFQNLSDFPKDRRGGAVNTPLLYQ